MSFTVTTNKEMKGDGVKVVSADVFNEISTIGGFGVRASGYDAHESLAVNEDTFGLDRIKALLTSKTAVEPQKDGK